jgi:hypothetical protein
MLRLPHPFHLLFASCLFAALALTGCGGPSFPDVQSTSGQVSVGPIQGVDWGGHAPLVGAHIFLLQAGTGGYGAKSTSLLSSAYSGTTYPTALDSVTGSPTNGFYYITSSPQGYFNLNGDYTCTAGDPVYLYASGGNPNTTPVVTVTGATGTDDAGGNLLITFNTTGNQLIYQGESVTFNAFAGGGAYSGFSGSTQTVSPLNLTTTTFAVELGASTSTVAYQAFSATVTQTTSPSNPAIVNLALLGVCPAPFNITGVPVGTSSSVLQGISTSDIAKLRVGEQIYGPGINYTTIVSIGASSVTMSGADTGGNGVTPFSYTVTPLVLNFGSSSSSPINFVYLNEVSTVAVATAMAPFTAVSSSQNDAVHIGTSSTNLTGLQNATYNAAKLYNIQGSTVGTGGDGDTHIANATTNDAAAGVVPQTLLDTMGNILANCVDSANTYNAATASGGTASAQCSTIFTNATSDGTTTGTKPNDTATASINVARFPGGTTSNPSYVSNIYNSLSGNAPYQPSLSSAPHDFAIGVLYAPPTGGTAGSGLQVDGSGNIWTLESSYSQLIELVPTGSYSIYSAPTGSSFSNSAFDGFAIDSTSTHVYVPAAAGMLVFAPGTSTGTLVSASNTANGAQVSVDGSGNLYIANPVSGSETTSYLAKETTAGVVAASPFPLTGNACLYQVQYLVLDGSGNIWTNNQYTVNNMICRYSSAGALQYSLTIPGSNFPLSYGIAMDAGYNAWFSEKDNSKLYKITNGTATTGNTICNAAAGCTAATGGTLNAPFAVAVDGANTIWTANSGSTPPSIVQFSNAAAAITPTFLSGTGYGNNYLFMQVDQSGSVWGMNNSYPPQLVEYIGVATPTAQPLSYARANSKIGTKP